MPDLLLELFSEEIPARFQRRAADDLLKAVTGGLIEAGLLHAGAKAFATPRRLALTVTGIPARSPDTIEEKKGPKVGAPQPALDGFLRAAGLSSIAEAAIESDPKKGDFYVARRNRPGAPATDLIANLLPRVVAGFSWPKSMHWGEGRTSWVRPLRAITATFGPETEETEVINFRVGGIEAGRTTYGHRFLAPEPLRVKRFEDYAGALEKAYVVLDADRRKDIIRAEADQLAFARGLTVIADEGLLEEVAGLVEWPVVMLGSFDPAFLSVPEEVIIATIRANQKCFCLRGPDGRLAPGFVITSNMAAEDGGAVIISGNERVIRARLSDAKFFYEQDLAHPLEEGLPKLEESVFHAKLGSQAERVRRLEALAAEIAPRVGADPGKARRAARLAKADLVTGMVGEFPELQGLMGRYYAAAQGEDPSVATAIEDHYKPLGPTDRVPTDPVAIAVALADKLDLLTGFWAINEKPTGSRDPFALRRAALGVIRILTENGLDFGLRTIVAAHLPKIPAQSLVGYDVVDDLMKFMDERLTISLHERGLTHDTVEAVAVMGSLLTGSSVVDIIRRVEALSGLLSSEDGTNLLAGYRRAANILAAEEKKDGRAYSARVDPQLLRLPAEQALATALAGVDASAAARVRANDYRGAIAALAGLRAPVDAFFEAVLVNDPDPAIRANRLHLLAALRDTMHLVADFSKVAG